MRHALIVAVAVVLAPAVALPQEQAQPGAVPSAPPPAAAPAPLEHVHKGFYLRFDAGVGYLSSSANAFGTALTMSGFALPFAVSVGGAVVENFVLAAEFWGSAGVSPTFSGGGTSTTPSDTSFALGGVGVQLTYYFMPHNIYVSLTPSVAGLSLNRGTTSSTAQVGFGAKVAVGKEWWIGRRWGLGAAAQFILGVNKDNATGNSPTWTTMGGGVALSVTYN